MFQGLVFPSYMCNYSEKEIGVVVSFSREF